MNSATLLNAMSDINDEYIEAAINVPADPVKKRAAFRPRYFAAACTAVALVSVVLVPAVIIGVHNIERLNLPLTTDNTPPPDDIVHNPDYYVLHGTAKNKFGSITFSEYSDNKIVLDLSIVDEAYWDNRSIAIYGYSFLPCVDSSGVDYASETTYYTTNYGQPLEAYDSIYLPDALSVEVDGVTSQDKSLPQKVGTYRIVLDFSAMLYVDEGMQIEEFTIGDICFKIS